MRRIESLAVTVSGFLSSTAGYMLASWQMTITSSLDPVSPSCAIAAAAIGAPDMCGGRGHLLRILDGMLLLPEILVGLSVLGASSFHIDTIGGSVIFIAVATGMLRVRMPPAR